MNEAQRRTVQVMFDQVKDILSEMADSDILQCLADDQLQKVIDDSIALTDAAVKERDRRKG